jgi:hypothetical protein
METNHTPLPYKRGGKAFGNDDNTGFNIVGANGQGFAFTVGLDPETDNANADFVAEACNSHYTLKAKADLVDELGALLQEATGFIEAWAQMHGKKPHLLAELNEALTKANKLTNGE